MALILNKYHNNQKISYLLYYFSIQFRSNLSFLNINDKLKTIPYTKLFDHLIYSIKIRYKNFLLKQDGRTLYDNIFWISFRNANAFFINQFVVVRKIKVYRIITRNDFD